jgi:hypothetical protein
MSEWTPVQRERRAAAEAGHCVVAGPSDGALLAWARATDRYVPISEWPNDRGSVASYIRALSYRPNLLVRIHELHGKVLGCPEDPLPRHAIALAEIVSRAVAGEGSIIELAVTVAAEWEGA